MTRQPIPQTSRKMAENSQTMGLRERRRCAGGFRLRPDGFAAAAFFFDGLLSATSGGRPFFEPLMSLTRFLPPGPYDVRKGMWRLIRPGPEC